MKSLQYFLNENEHVEKELSTAEKVEDTGIDKDEKKQIEEDNAEKKRVDDENKRLKEENAKED